MLTRQNEILEVNKQDIHEAKRNGLDGAMLARLALTPGKLQSLSAGIEQVVNNINTTNSACSQMIDVTDFRCLLLVQASEKWVGYYCVKNRLHPMMSRTETSTKKHVQKMFSVTCY